MKTKQIPPTSLSGAAKGTSEVRATLDGRNTSGPDMALHSSENLPITIKKSDVRLVQAERITRAVLHDGSEILVRETPHDIWLQLNS